MLEIFFWLTMVLWSGATIIIYRDDRGIRFLLPFYAWANFEMVWSMLLFAIHSP